MMRITQCKIDNKGRITIPKSFLKANHIHNGCTVTVENVYAARADNMNQVKLIFHNNQLNKNIDYEIISEYEKNPSK